MLKITARVRDNRLAVAVAIISLTCGQAAAHGIYQCKFRAEGSPENQCEIDSSSQDENKRWCEKKLKDDLAALCNVTPINDGIFKGTDVLICVFKSPSSNSQDIVRGILPSILSTYTGIIKSFPAGAFSGGYTSIFPRNSGNLTAIHRENQGSPQWSASCSGPRI
jgi:hypothetical protein